MRIYTDISCNTFFDTHVSVYIYLHTHACAYVHETIRCMLNHAYKYTGTFAYTCSLARICTCRSAWMHAKTCVRRYK